MLSILAARSRISNAVELTQCDWSAALILSVAPKLTEKQVRDILASSAAKLLPNGKLDPTRKRNNEMGWGRLDIHAALRLALHP